MFSSWPAHIHAKDGDTMKRDVMEHKIPAFIFNDVQVSTNTAGLIDDAVCQPNFSCLPSHFNMVARTFR